MPDKPDPKQKQPEQRQTHYQQLEGKYADTEWLDRLTQSPEIPIELALYLAAFQGDPPDEIFLPFEVAHIYHYLFEVGPVAYGAMGAIPVSFSEINQWMAATGNRLNPWEAVLLRQCSAAWVSAQQEAREPYAIPPWTVQTTADHRKAVADRLKSALGGSAKRKKK